MSITGLFITNLTGSVRSIDFKIAPDRQIRQRLQPYASSTNIANLCTPAELNRNDKFQAARDAGLLAATATAATGNGDIPQIIPATQILNPSGAPRIDRVTGLTVSISGAPASKAFVGRNLRQGCAHASIVFGTGTAAVTVTSLRPGTPGNFIAVALVDNAAASVAISGGAVIGEPSAALPRVITVNYRGALNGNVDDATAVAALINAATTTAGLLVYAAGGGAGIPVAAAAANLAGGTGSGFKVFLGGVEQNVIGATGVTDTALPLRTIAVPGANLDSANLYLVSNGVQSNDYNMNIVT